MRLRRRPVAIFCIALVALAGFLPGLAWLDAAWFEPTWVLLPDDTRGALCVPFVPAPELLDPLLPASESRGPPPLLAS